MVFALKKMTLQKTCRCVCVLIMFCTSCGGRTLNVVDNDNNATVKSDETVYYLDINKPSIVQPIEPGDKVQEGCKFVQVEVTKVLNPKRHPLTFQVHYQLKRDEKIYLGSFSLYPADNPGKFIVATQGKLKNEGAIILSLITPDEIDAQDELRVTVKKIKFLKG